MNFIKQCIATGVAFSCVTILTLTPGPQASAAEGDAQKERQPFSFEVSTGLRYSSKVSIEELDTFTSGDLAALLGAEARFKLKLTRNTRINLGYDFSQSLQEDLGQFNIQSHFASAAFFHDLGKIKVGVAQRYLLSRLDGANFLTYRQTAPCLTMFLSKKVFLRAELGFADKDFDIINERDADVRSAGADVFLFLNGSKTYLLFGYRIDQQDAVAAEHDFDRNNFKIHLIKKIRLGERDLKLNIGWRYEIRDYSDITPSIGVVRDERRGKIRAQIDLPLMERFEATFKYEFRNIQSNLPTVDRTDNYASIELRARF